MEYPIRITKGTISLFTLRRDEVKFDNNGRLKTIEISDAFERMLWDLSSSQLDRLRNEVLKNGIAGQDNQFFAEIFMQINKVISQRKFMQDNQALRSALIPE